MSTSGVWVVAALEGQDVTRLTSRFRAALAAHTSDPEVRERWQRWADAPELVTGYRPESPNSLHQVLDEASLSFLELDDIPIAQAGSLIHDCWNSASQQVDPACITARKAAPVLALFYGLGPERAAKIPGWCGNFLLTPAECQAALADIETILAPSQPQWSQTLARINFWLTKVGDANSDADQMTSKVLECWRAAAAKGLGLCGITDMV